MQKFFVMSVVAAVLSTGCASSKGAEAGTSTEASGLEAQRQTVEHTVSNANWAKVDVGPLSVVGMVGVGQFDGEAVCYASEGPSCGSASSAAADLGTRVFSCAGRCSAENGGRVEAGKILCCGANTGRGGKLRITYAK